MDLSGPAGREPTEATARASGPPLRSRTSLDHPEGPKCRIPSGDKPGPFERPKTDTICHADLID